MFSNARLWGKETNMPHGDGEYDDLQNLLDMTSHENPLLLYINSLRLYCILFSTEPKPH